MQATATSKRSASLVGGCVAGLTLFVILAFIHDWLMTPTVNAELRHWLALVSAALLALGLQSFWNLARGYGRGERSLDATLERARTGEPPADGETIVARGTVRALAAPLSAPLSGIECAGYMYRMYYHAVGPRGRRIDVPVFWGLAFRPFAIDTPAYRHRVLAVPQLLIDPTIRADQDALVRARAFVREIAFEPVAANSLAAAGTAFAIARDLFSDDDGDSRRDWKRTGDERDPADLILEETVLPAKATASVQGTWSVERSAIVPDPASGGGLGVSVSLGPPEELVRRSGQVRSFGSYLVMSTLLTAIGIGIVWFAITIMPRIH